MLLYQAELSLNEHNAVLDAVCIQLAEIEVSLSNDHITPLNRSKLLARYELLNSAKLKLQQSLSISQG